MNFLQIWSLGLLCLVIFRGNAIASEAREPGLVNLVARWGSTEIEGGPTAVAVDRRAGDVYVIDAARSPTIKKFRATGTLAATWKLDFSLGVNEHGVAVDGAGSVYVIDTLKNRIVKFDPSGKFRMTWGSTGSSEGQFKRATGIAVDMNDNIYVTDPGNSRIQKFLADGTFVSQWEKLGSSESIAVSKLGYIYCISANTVQKISQSGALVKSWNFSSSTSLQSIAVVPSRLSGIAVDDNDSIYVSDVQNHRVIKFDDHGQLQAIWGGKGKANGSFNFRQIAGIALDSSGNILVADYWNYRIQQFNPSGIFLGQWKGFAGESNFKFPGDIAIDSKGVVYVTDTRNHRILKFSSNGEYLGQWGNFGRGNGEFQSPHGIGVDKSGNVYVTDRVGIQKFSPAGSPLAKWGAPKRFEDMTTTQSWNHVAVGPSGALYVTSFGMNGDRIYKFSSSGRALGDWPVMGSPLGIAVDGQEHVYVTLTRQSVHTSPPHELYRIQRYDSRGRLLATWGVPGAAEHQLWHPSGIVVDAQGSVYVSAVPGRIKKYDSTGNFLFSWGPKGVGEGRFGCSDPALALDDSSNLYATDPCGGIFKFALGKN